jgi:hypothetical protein
MNNTINFEEASREWRWNKKAIKGGSFIKLEITIVIID